jgi:hypothetical protein
LPLPSASTPGTTTQKSEKITTILEHKWAPFVGSHGKSMMLPAGNYEYPFEYTLPGDTPESVEGIPEASITYRIKATVGRGKLAYDLHAYKHLRVIRTLEPGALEFLHAMSVENIWPNKVDYSIIIPQKAVVFGGVVDLEMRITPLLKGLELGVITAKMTEIRESALQGPTGLSIREHKVERDVSTWRFEVDREEHWHDMIEDTGQEGWCLKKKLHLPKKLRQCIQDINHHGIKVRHKIKLVIALKNPDGHVSELRATLPISIFISPNVPLDEQGNLIDQSPNAASAEQTLGSLAPPGYGEHVLDQLYEDVDPSGFMTPAIHSGMNSPFYAQSRSGSSENLASLVQGHPITPAALSSRLADVSMDPTLRSTSFNSTGHASPNTAGHGHRSEPSSTPLTRHNSGDDAPSGRESPENVEFAELSRVPSYSTAVRTPARVQAADAAAALPNYETALSTPRTPPVSETPPTSDYLTTITEERSAQHGGGGGSGGSDSPGHSPPSHSRSISLSTSRRAADDGAAFRRLHLIRARDQVV